MKFKIYLCLMFAGTIVAHGQISGGLDLAPKSQSPAKSQQSALKEIAVTSVGATPEGAEKRAISDAIRQAVGAFVDAKTITENDAVIKDRILSVSSGFVKEYKATSPAQKTDDGLYQVSIVAIVETNQVAAALEEAKIVSGEMDGKSLWAESSSKIMNTQDARKMLEEKLPEMYKSLLKMKIVDKEGNPSNDATPISRIENKKNNSVTLNWLIEFSIDQEDYKTTTLPLIKKCFEALAGCAAEPFQLKYKAPDSYGGRHFGIAGKFHKGLIIISDFSRSLDQVEGLYFEKPTANFEINYEYPRQIVPHITVEVKLKSSQGELIATNECDAMKKGDTYYDPLLSRYQWPAQDIDIQIASSLIAVAGCDGSMSVGSWYPSRKMTCPVSITIPISDIKDVSKVEFDLHVAKLKILLKD
jgi:hypothetical protein